MTTNDGKIACEICGARIHLVDKHLKEMHPEVNLAQYQERYPSAPLLSDRAKEMIRERQAQLAAQQQKDAAPAPAQAPAAPAPAATMAMSYVTEGKAIQPLPDSVYTAAKGALMDVFSLPKTAAMKASTSRKDGSPVQCRVFTSNPTPEMVPEANDGYVYDVEELRTVLAGLELNIPIYIWGHKGAGKSELGEQICARTGRPMIRLQHTVNTEESQIVGQWAVEKGETVFHLGPLPQAMLNGWVYMADEYDFALPSVLSVYQAVLEGKPLYIKEAPPHMRIIKPHTNFRFLATGNTNGSGDESGLYGGTQMQNAANYDRFGVVLNKQYMKPADEKAILMNRTGLDKDDAERFVRFATKVREAFGAGKISDTVSPRALINAVRMGVARGDLRLGLDVAFINKLSTVDRKVVSDLAQREFG